jgi:general secretion pathway protein L
MHGPKNGNGIMPLLAILKHWVELLARTLVAFHEAWRAKRSLSVVFENGQFVIWQKEPDGRSPLAVVPLGSRADDVVTRTARKALVNFELPSDKVVVRRISVPAQAQGFLDGIIRNQIERLSPWHADQAAFGFHATTSPDDAAVLDVRVLIASRAAVDDALGEVNKIGLTVDRVEGRERGEPNANRPVLLWSRIADGGLEDIRGACWAIGAAIAACVALSASISLWAAVSAASISDETETLSARASKLQQSIRTAPTAASLASLNPRERAWVEKETSPSAAILLEALSRALPDAAYLTELHVEKSMLRIVGVASDAPSLIAPLERSSYLLDAHFFAPTTRGVDGARFKFYIEAQINPQAGNAGPQPW